jgi:hypothetical protein
MILYSHGNRLGDIGSGAWNQAELIQIIKQQNFKLAKLYLMHCYSGFEGRFNSHYDSF